ncbi:MAG: hypothetical protein WAU23_12895 [Ferruginibacter sp.]
MNKKIRSFAIKQAVLVCVITLGVSTGYAQINLNKLKKVAEKTSDGNNKNTQTQSNGASGSQSQTSGSGGSVASSGNVSSGTKSQGGALTKDEETAWWTYYQSATQEAEAMVWREGLYDEYLLSSLAVDSRKVESFLFFLDGLDKKIETDKKRMKEPFMFYGNKAEMPEGMEYGGPNRDFLGSRLGSGVNKSVTKYYNWRATVKTKYYAEFAQCIQRYLNESKRFESGGNTGLGFAFRYANTAILLCDAISKFQPQNRDIIRKRAEAQTQYDGILAALRPSLAGNYHENHLEKISIFNQKQTPGKESKEQEIQEIIPGKPTYLVAYAVDPLITLGAKSTMSTGGRPKLPYLQLKDITVDDQSEPVVVPIYCNEPIYNKMKDAFYVDFEMFPDLSKTNYESHLNYMSSLHLTEFFLSRPVGTYTYELLLGELNGTIGPKSVFTIRITEESKKELQAYHDQMWAKKLATVTFNTQYGAGDDRNMVMNWEDLNRHGKLVKLSVTQTGKVMRPWPNESQVESFVGSGWILVERADGKHEVIGYSFVKKAGDKLWRVTAIASDMDYYVVTVPSSIGQKVNPKRLEFGYEIPKENITKGNTW